MALDSIVRKGISIANRQTQSLQSIVQHYSFIGRDDAGDLIYSDAPVLRRALVEIKNQLLQTSSAQIVQARSKITFLSPVDINPEDRLILPDGSTGPILDIQGMIDPKTNKPYAPEVYLG